MSLACGVGNATSAGCIAFQSGIGHGSKAVRAIIRPDDTCIEEIIRQDGKYNNEEAPNLVVYWYRRVHEALARGFARESFINTAMTVAAHMPRRPSPEPVRGRGDAHGNSLHKEETIFQVTIIEAKRAFQGITDRRPTVPDELLGQNVEEAMALMCAGYLLFLSVITTSGWHFFCDLCQQPCHTKSRCRETLRCALCNGQHVRRKCPNAAKDQDIIRPLDDMVRTILKATKDQGTQEKKITRTKHQKQVAQRQSDQKQEDQRIDTLLWRHTRQRKSGLPPVVSDNLLLSLGHRRPERPNTLVYSFCQRRPCWQKLQTASSFGLVTLLQSTSVDYAFCLAFHTGAAGRWKSG
ncbi:hypothetical protein TgHK011_006715 [Trichoderma gracile]|nr:hypothetical protein TgHK011_006715 [Trichoderma gracile]